VNTHSSRNAVVPERFATMSLRGSDVTYKIRPSARTVENRIPAAPGRTSGDGGTPTLWP
jgi:hypothetical protein